MSLARDLLEDVMEHLLETNLIDKKIMHLQTLQEINHYDQLLRIREIEIRERLAEEEWEQIQRQFNMGPEINHPDKLNDGDKVWLRYDRKFVLLQICRTEHSNEYYFQWVLTIYPHSWKYNKYASPNDNLHRRNFEYTSGRFKFQDGYRSVHIRLYQYNLFDKSALPPEPEMIGPI